MTIFKQIIDGEIPSEKVFENARLLAIKDKFPIAPVHILILPKKEYASLQEIPESDFSIFAEIIAVAKTLATEFGVEDNYRFLTNVGSLSGQSIFHLHFHLIGGRQLGPMG